MKTCARCKELKPMEEFASNKSRKDGRQSSCKICQREYVKEHYRKNVQYYVDKAKRRKDVLIEENHKRFREYLKDKSCLVCGETDPLVFHFDHRDPKTKKHGIANMLRREFTWEQILEEIEKCDILCANDHLRKTAIQLGWRKACW